MAPPTALSSARRFGDALDALGFSNRVVTFDQTTRTAADAAAAIGCTVAQIAKSLVFKTAGDARPVLVVASGTNRVDVKAVSGVLAERTGGAAIRRADADFVRDHTGYAIGGVAPVGHVEPMIVAIDADLFAHATIWAAAGTPNAVFELTPAQLREMTGGIVAEIAERD